MPPFNGAPATATPARAGRVAQLHEEDVMDVDLSPSQNGGVAAIATTQSSQAEDQVIGDILQQAMVSATQHANHAHKAAASAGVAQDVHLLQVLVRALILDRANSTLPLEPTSHEHILESLKVFENRAARAYDVFLSMLDDQDDLVVDPPLPLYKWLIPRLIHAASLHGLHGALKIRREIETCVVKIMLAVGTGMGPVEESGAVQSLERMMDMLEGLAKGLAALQGNEQRGGFACLVSDQLPRSLLEKPTEDIALDKTPLYLIPLPLKPLEATSLALSIASVVTLAMSIKPPSVPMWSSMSGKCTSVIARSLSSMMRTLQARCTALGGGGGQAAKDELVVLDMLVATTQVCLVLLGSSVVPAPAATQTSIAIAELVIARLQHTHEIKGELTGKLHELDVKLAECLLAARSTRAGKLGGHMWTRLVAGLCQAKLPSLPDVANELSTAVMAAILLPPGGQSNMIAFALASADAQHNVGLLCSKLDDNSSLNEELAEAYRRYAIDLKSLRRQTRGVKRKLDGAAAQMSTQDLQPISSSSNGENVEPPAVVALQPQRLRLGQGDKHSYFDQTAAVVKSFGLVIQQGQIRSGDTRLHTQVLFYVNLHAAWGSGGAFLSDATSHVIQVLQKFVHQTSADAHRIVLEALRAFDCLYCIDADCETGCHRKIGDTANYATDHKAMVNWVRMADAIVPHATANADLVHAMLVTLRNAIAHKGNCHSMFPFRGSSTSNLILRGFEDTNRKTRRLAARCLIDIYSSHRLADDDMITQQLSDALHDEFSTLSNRHQAFQEAMLLSVSEIAKQIKIESPLFGKILEIFMMRSGATNPAMQALARLELTAILKHRNQRAYAVMSPYFATLAPRLVRSDARGLAKACAFLGISVDAFVMKTLSHTLPVLVLEGDRPALVRLAGFANQKLGGLLLEQMHAILAAIVFQDSTAALERSASFFVNLVNSLKKSPTTKNVGMDQLVATCVIPFLVEIVVQLGDPKTESRAERALQRAQVFQSKSKTSRPDEGLGSYLKPYMLGIISFLNDMLQETQGRMTIEEKCKVIRSFGKLIEHVGDAIMVYSPQIMSCVQGSLAVVGLRLDCLRTLYQFVSILKFQDIGPYIGTVVAATASVWTEMTDEERSIAGRIIRYLLVDNIQDLHPEHLNDVIALDHIPDLAKPAQKLAERRKKWGLVQRLRNILRRINNENIAVATRSVVELQVTIEKYRDAFVGLAKGDSFDSIITELYRSLLSTAGRDGDHCQELRDASLQCMGAVGALDPDRFQSERAASIVLVRGVFTDHDESIDFVLHLIEDVLVGAFRTTHDSKHQGHLAYAIQELLKFCDFSQHLISQSSQNRGTISNKTRQRWLALPRNMLETLTPLLEARFSLGDVPLKQQQYPIYPRTATYREWIQRWTSDLISRVQAIPETNDRTKAKLNTAIKDGKEIFGVFRGVLRSQDVTVAHHILPYIVLHLLTSSNDPQIGALIANEVKAVLSDQSHVDGDGRADRRLLSAQAVFELLDHLSRWLQEQRGNKETRKRKDGINERTDTNWLLVHNQMRAVEGFLSRINPELTAQAAANCKAYARALRDFEAQIELMKKANFDEKALEPQYEQLHHIYAELEEPDGMLGVSTKIVSPSVEHQIREHESVGRWTSAQSCWEVRLQMYPDAIDAHLGLLGCLRSLGHYDTLRTHVRGVLSRRPEWAPQLACYQVEAAWIVGDWHEVSSVVESGAVGPEISMAKALLAFQRGQTAALPEVLRDVRRELGVELAAVNRQYARAYPVLVNLHMLHEVEQIMRTIKRMSRSSEGGRAEFDQLDKYLKHRLDTTLPSFRVREPILSIRRTTYKFSPTNLSRVVAEVGRSWIATAKIARKAGFEQTAYSAILQANNNNAEFAYLQHVKLLKAIGQPLQALAELEHAVAPFVAEQDRILGGNQIDLTGIDEADHQDKQRQNAKAISLSAKWSYETNRLEMNPIVARFKKAASMAPHSESPYYHLGHYYDAFASSTGSADACHAATVESYAIALRFGTKNIYQTMPRMLTLWLDLGERSKLNPDQQKVLERMNSAISSALRHLAPYEWLTAFPQIVSRIAHPNAAVYQLLEQIMINVVSKYPRQAMWSIVGLYHSNKQGSAKAKRAKSVCNQVSNVKDYKEQAQFIKDAILFSRTMLDLSVDDGKDETFNPKTQKYANQGRSHLSIAKNFEYVNRVFPTSVILPLQDALTCTLPSSGDSVRSHNPFPGKFVTIHEISDGVEIMGSLQRPKKITFIGDNGKRYNFLVKPHDDLRKDARLMDFNSMINKLLRSDSEARKRKLYIRTYAVSPLNEECGMLEWVNHTIPMKVILTKAYERHQKKVFTNELYAQLDRGERITNEAKRKEKEDALTTAFRDKVLPAYKPAVFHEWFLQTFPEPNTWFAARLAYARTLAVMSMVGYVLGLGDRHGENILFDSTTGDTVHVDFNCLFEKGRTFDVPERVPFRLTHNMVDAMGVTGVDGVFRRAAEISLQSLRSNRESLTSVLESFVHDPLVEWEEQKKRQDAREQQRRNGVRADIDLRKFANKALDPIQEKLKGTGKQGEMSVVNQVDALIKEATELKNLANMYIGWAAWL